MKTINLYFKFAFTSRSPDAQPISLAVVSEEVLEHSKYPDGGTTGIRSLVSKSFYSEFSDFDINRCDDWVKENVVEKLQMKNNLYDVEPNHWNIKAPTDQIIKYLKKWLWSFREYNIQFVTDCGTWDWYWMLQLLAEWETKPCKYILDAKYIPNGMTASDFMEQWKQAGDIGFKDSLAVPHDKVEVFEITKTGLPKLPDNISPVPEDLNDLIARVKGISVREAFDLNRESLAYLKIDLYGESETECFGKRVGDTLEIERVESQKHNALFDARVIKEIYQKLK